jgi:Zn finger protein HypA/HybF involved in hydrogenase expression
MAKEQMKNLQSVPFKLSCAQCSYLLLEAYISIESDELIPDAIIVDHADMVCPECRYPLKSSFDDLTRAVKAILESDQRLS